MKTLNKTFKLIIRIQDITEIIKAHHDQLALLMVQKQRDEELIKFLVRQNNRYSKERHQLNLKLKQLNEQMKRNSQCL